MLTFFTKYSIIHRVVVTPYQNKHLNRYYLIILFLTANIYIFCIDVVIQHSNGCGLLGKVFTSKATRKMIY